LTIVPLYVAPGNPGESKIDSAPREKELPVQSRTEKFLIIQSSHPDTGSTLLSNLLMGLFDPVDADYGLLRFHNGKKQWVINDRPYTDIINGMNLHVIKTHSIEIKNMAALFEPYFGDNVFFIRSHRCKHDPQCEMHNVLCIKYDHLLYKTSEDKKKVIDGVASTVSSMIFKGLKLQDIKVDVDKAVRRLDNMDSVTAQKADPDKTSKEYFKEATDTKYGIHANHKGQSKTWRKKGTSPQAYCDMGAKYTR